MKLSVLIPCYNEEETIEEVIKRTQGVQTPYEKEIIVVDDGSTDRSCLVVERYPKARLVRHTSNRGKGQAVRTGLEYATGEIVAIQDADMEYRPEDLPKLIKPILEGRADAVLGSRFIDGAGGMSGSHWLANRFLSLVATLLYHHRISDVMTGHKGFRTEVLRGLDLRSSEFEIETEIVAKLIAKGYRVKEVPIKYRYRKKGVAKINWRHGLRSLYVLLRIGPLGGFPSKTIHRPSLLSLVP